MFLNLCFSINFWFIALWLLKMDLIQNYITFDNICSLLSKRSHLFGRMPDWCFQYQKNSIRQWHSRCSVLVVSPNKLDTSLTLLAYCWHNRWPQQSCEKWAKIEITTLTCCKGVNSDVLDFEIPRIIVRCTLKY